MTATLAIAPAFVSKFADYKLSPSVILYFLTLTGKFLPANII
jgi:hypothetical protein